MMKLVMVLVGVAMIGVGAVADHRAVALWEMAVILVMMVVEEVVMAR